METVYRKGNVEVKIESCLKYIDGSVKNFHIKETDSYYTRQYLACQAAKQLLLKKMLSEQDLNERQEKSSRLQNAHKVVNINNCVMETEAYIEKWSGVLYLETKKQLCAEMKQKLLDVCSKYGFANAGEAIDLLARGQKERIK
jgi:DNA-directed RNA polymerase subunit F